MRETPTEVTGAGWLLFHLLLLSNCNNLLIWSFTKLFSPGVVELTTVLFTVWKTRVRKLAWKGASEDNIMITSWILQLSFDVSETYFVHLEGTQLLF